MSYKLATATSIILFASLSLVSCAVQTPPAKHSTPAAAGVRLLGIDKSDPTIPKPTIVCFEGGTPGIVASVIANGDGMVRVVLSQNNTTLMSSNTTVWPTGSEPGQRQGHVEISLVQVKAAPGTLHVQLDGIDESSVKFDVAYTGHGCGK